MISRSRPALLLSLVLLCGASCRPAQPAGSDSDISAPARLETNKENPSQKKSSSNSEPDALAAINHKAITAFEDHQLDVAQQLMEKVVSGLSTEQGSELSLCQALENLHLILDSASKTKEAEQVLSRAGALRKKFHMPLSTPELVEIPPTAPARKQRTDLVSLTAAIVEGRDPLFGTVALSDKSADEWSSLMITARHQQETGELKKAAQSLRRALAIAAVLPPATGNDKFCASLTQLAGVYRSLERLDCALILYLACAERYEKAAKAETADYANILANAGQTLFLLHDYTYAETIFERAAGAFKKALGPENADMAMVMCNLGQVYLADKQDQKGEETISGALSILRKVLKPEDMRILITDDCLAQIYLKRGKLKEAEDLQKSIVATMEKVVGKGRANPDLCLSMNNLARTLYQEKKYTEAEPLLKTCIDMNKSLYGEKDSRFLQSINTYLVFLEKTGHKEEADRLLRQITAPR
jgi:tetratricopeptide (TPR) repeat protein